LFYIFLICERERERKTGRERGREKDLAWGCVRHKGESEREGEAKQKPTNLVIFQLLLKLKTYISFLKWGERDFWWRLLLLRGCVPVFATQEISIVWVYNKNKKHSF
jgi:hypothetical protein